MFVRVHVTPGVRREAVKRLAPDRFKISVRDRAENNLANRRTLALLADHLQVPRQSMRIVTGQRHPNKIIFVRSG